VRHLAAVLTIALLAATGLHWRDERTEGSAVVESGAGSGSSAAAEAPAAAADSAAGSWRMPVPGLTYNAREGRAVFRHYCATCHGDEAHGDGLNAYNLDPKPRDLADPPFQSKRSDEDLRAVIRSGGGAAGLSTGMPPFSLTLNERRIRNLVEYIRTLQQPSDAPEPPGTPPR